MIKYVFRYQPLTLQNLPVDTLFNNHLTKRKKITFCFKI